jgi:hypothetical protein
MRRKMEKDKLDFIIDGFKLKGKRIKEVAKDIYMRGYHDGEYDELQKHGHVELGRIMEAKRSMWFEAHEEGYKEGWEAGRLNQYPDTERAFIEGFKAGMDNALGSGGGQVVRDIDLKTAMKNFGVGQK